MGGGTLRLTMQLGGGGTHCVWTMSCPPPPKKKKKKQHCVIRTFRCPWREVANRPYALTSRLHNNDAMLGVKTCRAARARVVLAERIGAQPLSQCAGPGQPGGWSSGCMLGDGARGTATFDPQRAWAPFCDVICIRSIPENFPRTTYYWELPRTYRELLITENSDTRTPPYIHVYTCTSVARGGQGAPIMLSRSFVSTFFFNLSVHVSREVCHLYRQSFWSTNRILKEIAVFEWENANIFLARSHIHRFSRC